MRKWDDLRTRATAVGWEWVETTVLARENGGFTCEADFSHKQMDGMFFRPVERVEGRPGWRCDDCLRKYLDNALGGAADKDGLAADGSRLRA